ncbi:hypothetical protein JCM1841_004474 [Sporobolomyces salmonicolor]
MEKVQLALERFLPELRDLQQKNVFTKDEIADIVAKRRGYETSLVAARATKPLDYLRYIEYEQRLEKLRKARVTRLQLTGKRTLSDHSIAAHITQLHRLSVRRFPESLALWDAFIAHSLTQDSPLLVSRTLSAAIAMHPTHTAYWIMASQWESDGDRKGMGGGNSEGARRLCMRALRFLKGKRRGGEEEREGDEEAVWREWIRVEVGFVERLRARQKVLGLGKGKMEEIIRVKEKNADEGDEHEEEEDQGVEVPSLEGEEDGQADEVQQDVEQKVLSGQEAILDGAIVRAVLDSLLKSYNHSIFAYKFLLSVLRPLPSTLRLPLLSHVYASLAAHILPSLSSYPIALHLLATRHLYDIPYAPPKQSKKRTADEAQVAEPEDPTKIRVEGEKLVDAVGKAAEEYWAVLKKAGKKGKGKAKETEGMQKIWEQFAAWLEDMAEETEDEDLLAFLSANLTSALSLAPLSPFLSLIHLRHLLRTSAPAPDILSFAQRMTKSFPAASTPPSAVEQLWVARLETALSLSLPASDIHPLMTQATRSLPYSSKLWDVAAEFIESDESSSTPDEIEKWYEAAIRRSLLTDALPPSSFASTFTDYAPMTPRELLPRRYVHYLATVSPAAVQPNLLALFASAPALSLSFLSYVLALSGPSLSDRKFRLKVHERIVAHPDAGADEWLAYAEETLRAGEVRKNGEVLRRARGELGRKGEGEVRRFESEWERVCSRLEE